MTDDRKIAFIICVNDELEYGEARYYIDRLYVPDGYTTDIINVEGAPGMAAGYNAGMQATDAEYKVYMHQDTFIINRNFIFDMLKVFESDEKIGMLGCVGAEEMSSNGRAINSYNVGKVYHNSTPRLLDLGQREDRKPVDVEMLDGFMLATRMDVAWREDLFDAWDFYDASECFEMLRAGFRVVVPYQENVWCFHDNTYSKMTDYEKYCRAFTEEYCDVKALKHVPYPKEVKELFDVREKSVSEMIGLVNAGNKPEVKRMLLDVNNRGYQQLRPFEILADIDAAEDGMHGIERRFWSDGDTWTELKKKLSLVRFAAKRMQFGADDDGMWDRVREIFGSHVAEIVRRAY